MIKIESFYNHHKELRAIILNVYEELNVEMITNKPQVVVQLLRKLFGRFAIHLKLENATLYNQLAKSSNLALRESAASFRVDMKEVTFQIDKYKTNWYNPQAVLSDIANFITETQVVLNNLERRIMQEEEEFYGQIKSFQKLRG